jgi:hypothetical protein
LERYWLSRVEAPLGEKLDEMHFRQIEARHRWRAFRRRRVVGAPRGASSEFLAQLWFNTLGPGARTWFGNATRLSVATPSVSVGDHDEPSSLAHVLAPLLAWLFAPVAVNRGGCRHRYRWRPPAQERKIWLPEEPVIVAPHNELVSRQAHRLGRSWT